MNDGGPAFPHTHIIGINGMLHDAQSVGGMSLRAYFAGQIIGSCLQDLTQSVLAGRCGAPEGWRDGIAQEAVKIADSLIAALEAKYE